jgi:hypothetical protein
LWLLRAYPDDTVRLGLVGWFNVRWTVNHLFGSIRSLDGAVRISIPIRTSIAPHDRSFGFPGAKELNGSCRSTEVVVGDARIGLGGGSIVEKAAFCWMQPVTAETNITVVEGHGTPGAT